MAENELMMFTNPEFGKIRTVMINGEPWFVAVDVAKALGYSKTESMTRLVDDDDKRNISSSDLGEQVYKQAYTIGIINESGLYAAIFGSKQENAKKFKKWVTSEVLPSIRRTGTYGQPQLPMTVPEQIKLLAQGHTELKAEVDEIRSDLESLKMDLPILPIEADKITEAVRKKGVSVLGGKQSNAYGNRSLRQKLYNSLYANLKYNFGVKSYKAIKRRECDKAVEIICKYEPPFFLAQQIENENAQQNLGCGTG